MKFLKAVRLDVSDSRVYAEVGAAEDGEWVVSGGYAVCDCASGAHFLPIEHSMSQTAMKLFLKHRAKNSRSGLSDERLPDLTRKSILGAMSTVDVTEIKQMPVADRLSVIEDIWDSIASESAQLEVPQWHRDMLRQRLAAYQANPAEGTPWPEVRRRIERS